MTSQAPAQPSAQQSVQQPERLHITWSEALKDYNLHSSILHTLTKMASTTDEEFEVKFNVMETMKNAGHNYGRVFQFGTLGSLIVFCMKSNMIKTKVFFGFMYTYWIAHFYTIGSHIGFYKNTKWACDQLNMDPKYRTGELTQEYIRRLRERDQKRANGLPYESENDFLREFYLLEASKEERKSYENTSYVSNNYFKKNYDKYLKTSEEENNPYKVFKPPSDNYEEELRVPLLDCFLSRYLYHNTKRWANRLLLVFGISND